MDAGQTVTFVHRGRKMTGTVIRNTMPRCYDPLFIVKADNREQYLKLLSELTPVETKQGEIA